MKPVSARKLRSMFNEGGYAEKVEEGELTARVQREHHPSPALAFEPFCTRSQIVCYYDDSGRKVAVVHQYLRPNGEIGASGKPDPKMLLHEGVRYNLRTK